MKRPVKKVKRFDDGGYTGDDPIVKYRMGKMSEADTYEALGQKDLANASRAKEPKVEPKEEPKTTKSIAPSDNFYDTSSEKEIADASFKTSSTETTKPVVKPAAPRSVAPKVESKPTSTSTSTSTPKVTATKSDDKENPKAVAEAYRQAAALNTPVESNFPIQKETKKGPSGKAKANRDAGKPSKSPNRSYKSGGTVKRSSASSRGDGIATKGHTRGRYI